MADNLFRDHLQGVFPQTCLNLSRKLWSLEQFAKYAAARAKLTQDYARDLDKLAAKTKAAANLYFEEAEVGKSWTQIMQAEVDYAKQQAALAAAIQERVAAQLTLVRTTTENLLKSIENDGQTATKTLSDSLQLLQKSSETYVKCNKELEAQQYKLEQDKKSGKQDKVRERDRRIQKIQTEAGQAEAAYRSAIESTTAVQSKHFDERLPSLLTQLQTVFTQRLTTIHDSFAELSSHLLASAEASVPVFKKVDDVVKSMSVQKEIEEYVSKTELYFTAPPLPSFQAFVKTPEGQVPALIVEQQSSWTGKFHHKLTALASSAPAEFRRGVGKGTSGLLLGKSLDVIMAQQATKYPNLKVPYGYVYLADCIIKLNGPSSQGCFRLSGKLSSIEAKKKELDQGKYVMPFDCNDASSLFKFFLRSLPDSLVPVARYDAAVNEPAGSHEVFNNLPEPNKTVAGFVIRYIREYFLLPDVIAATEMSLENIITCFVPCFLRSPSVDMAEFVKHADQERAWMRKCLTTLDVSHFPTLNECLAAASMNTADTAVPTSPTADAAGGAAASAAGGAVPQRRAPPPPAGSKPQLPRKALPPTPPS